MTILDIGGPSDYDDYIQLGLDPADVHTFVRKERPSGEMIHLPSRVRDEFPGAQLINDFFTEDTDLGMQFDYVCSFWTFCEGPPLTDWMTQLTAGIEQAMLRHLKPGGSIAVLDDKDRIIYQVGAVEKSLHKKWDPRKIVEDLLD